MKTNEYECALCGGIFEKGWTDAEALAEYSVSIPEEHKSDDNVVVCDD